MKKLLPSAMIAASILVSGLHASARTDVPAKIQQLKENKENSKTNLKQYEDNLKTVNSNLSETAKALKMLDLQKQALAKQTADTTKGKQSVDAAKKQLEGFMKAEQLKLDQEQQQIEALKKTLAQLEENVKARQVNITQYQEKMQKVDTELASWSERNQSIVDLEKAIKEKEDQAKAEQKRLTEKKATYEEEVGKWKKQARVSERQYENFSKLKD